MIGTELVQTLVQSVALTHLVKGQSRVSVLLLAAPESGKTTISTAATCKHVCRVAIISGRSILRELKDHPHTEFLLFNDMSSVRAMSHAAVALLVVLLNQLTQDERGVVAFAGKESEQIERCVGVIGCMPFKTFSDHRAKWKELGFVSRMLPFSYAYSPELIAEIKDCIDQETHRARKQPDRKMPRAAKKPVTIHASDEFIRQVRHLADAKADTLGQLGIRLLQNYHALVRAHALLMGRHTLCRDDLKFLRKIDEYVSITDCVELPSAAAQAAAASNGSRRKRTH